MRKKEYIDTRKMLLIWFSNKPNQFLNPENILRLIRRRIDNQNAHITLIYSSLLLSSTALQEMQNFAKRLNIATVDIKDLNPASYRDEMLLEIANTELARWVENTGGNPAGASDSVRLLKCVVSSYGIYTDFDTELNTSNLPRLLEINSSLVHSDRNNDFVAFACYENGQLTENAERLLEQLQDIVIKNYADPTNALSTKVSKAIFMQSRPVLLGIIKPKISNNTIFDIRHAFQNLTVKDLVLETIDSAKADPQYLMPQYDDASKISNASEEELYRIRAELVEYTLIKLSEMSDIYRRLFLSKIALIRKDYIEYGKEVYQSQKRSALLATVCTISGPDTYLELPESSSHFLSNVPELNRAFYSRNSIEWLNRLARGGKQSLEEGVGQAGDQSWTEIGAQSAVKRDEVITTSITKLQAGIRGYIARKTCVGMQR